MGFLTDTIAFLTDPANWSGESGLLNRLGEHVLLSVLALLVAMIVVIPIGAWIGHTGKGAFLAVNVGNAGRAVPIFAVLVLFVLLPAPLGANLFSFTLALALFSIPPLLTNTYTGVREVDGSVVEAARGMGLSEGQILRQVEMPLALPLIATGIRLAAVQIVATATVIGLVGGGGLGRVITTGFAIQNQGMVIGGALVVTVFALLVEGGLELVERRVRATPGERGAARDDKHQPVAA